MDKWKVEFLDNTAPDIDEYDVEAKDVMLSMYTKFRLRNVVNGCVLRSKFFSFINPNDATCLKSEKKDTYTVWNIEQQWNEKREI